MKVLGSWDHVDDVTPDELTRSDQYQHPDRNEPFRVGDIVTVADRPKQTFRFMGHVVNHTRDDEYVSLLGIGPKATFGKSYTVHPSKLEST